MSSAGLPVAPESPAYANSLKGPSRATPASISQLLIDYRCAKALFVAAKLELFSRLSENGQDVEQISRSLKLKSRPARIFLDMLVAMGFLEKKGPRYFNFGATEEFLVKGNRNFLGDNLKYQDFLWDSWSGLENVLRRGVPRAPLDVRLKGQKKFIRDYILAMDDIAKDPAKEISRELGPTGAAELLDVGGGPGAYALTLLANNPELRATILDLPGTLRITRKCVAKSPCRDRVRLLSGSYHTTNIGREAYDIIILSHVTHNEGEVFNQRLLRRCYAALRPGGRIVIHDFMTDDTRTAPLYPALFSVHMLVSTREGRTYSEDEYETWLKKAGFHIKSKTPICPSTPNSTKIIAALKD